MQLGLHIEWEKKKEQWKENKAGYIVHFSLN